MYDSISTSGKKLKPNQFYVELIFFNRHNKRELPDNFWKAPAFKRVYGRIIKCISAIAKATYNGAPYPEEAIIDAIVRNEIKFDKFEKDIPLVHHLVQKECDRIARINLPKDHLCTEKEKENKKAQELADLRTEEEKTKGNSQKSFFELENI